MKKLNKSRYAVLGILAEKPRSGYEILRFMRQATSHFWQESDASLYPMLRLLEKEGKIVGHEESHGKRKRRVFEITEEGLEELRAWLALPVQEEVRRSEFLLKLFFGALREPHSMLTQLQEHHKKIAHEKRTYKHIEEQALTKVPETNLHKRFWIMALEYGITQCSCEERWLKDSIARLQEQEKQSTHSITK